METFTFCRAKLKILLYQPKVGSVALDGLQWQGVLPQISGLAQLVWRAAGQQGEA